MKPLPELRAQVANFQASYDAERMDQTWADLSNTFRTFWDNRVMSPDQEPISDDDCDRVIRVLDRNGKGNTKDSQAVAKVMIPQGAWRRMLNLFHEDRRLGKALQMVLTESNDERKAAAIDELYRINGGAKNYLAGKSGNAICAYLAAYDPAHNLSVVSLNDRRAILDYLGVELPFAWDQATIGTRIVATNKAIHAAGLELGLAGTARTVSRFFYFPDVKAFWKDEHTLQLEGRSVNVAVPTETDDEATEASNSVPLSDVIRGDVLNGFATPDEIRESMQIQALLAKIGTQMGFTIWLPKADRGRVLKAWTPAPGELLETLPMSYDATTLKTIAQIDVLWVRKRSIARAFEVEHTTSIYSGLLRMADLVALLPDINVKLHIVASVARQAKVLQEINRPVFAMVGSRPLSEMCTFLSYDHIREISELKHLARLSDAVLEDYQVTAEGDDD